MNRAAVSRSPDTNWLDPDASTSRCPPVTPPVGCMVKGRKSPLWRVISTPRSSRASRIGLMGRTFAPSSPSMRMVPLTRVAAMGRKRITVPASPQSMVMSPTLAPWVKGVTVMVVPSADSVMSAPSARRAVIISCESRERSAPWMVVGSAASAARSRCRLVRDFDPGTVTVAVRGPG